MILRIHSVVCFVVIKFPVQSTCLAAWLAFLSTLSAHSPGSTRQKIYGSKIQTRLTWMCLRWFRRTKAGLQNITKTFSKSVWSAFWGLHLRKVGKQRKFSNWISFVTVELKVSDFCLVESGVPDLTLSTTEVHGENFFTSPFSRFYTIFFRKSEF